MDVEYDRIRFVTANYYQLQGLRLVPVGLILVLLGLLDAVWLPPTGGADRASVLTRVGFAFMLLLALAIVAPVIYRLRYGSIAPVDRGWRNGWITAAVIGFFALYRLDRFLQWPVRTSLLLVSASLFITVWHDGRIRAHYLVPAFAWLAVSLLPVLNLSAGDAKLTLFVLGGLTLIWGGIGDHLLLTRTVATPRTTDDVSQPAAF